MSTRYFDTGFSFEPIEDHSNDEDRAWENYRASDEYRLPAERAAAIEAKRILQYIPSFRSER